MSASDKRLVAGIALALCSCLALAGIGRNSTRPIPSTDPGVAVSAPEGGIHLRCWQHGRLLFDETSLDAPPKLSAGALALTVSTVKGQLQLLDLETAVCLVLPAGSAGPLPPTP